MKIRSLPVIETFTLETDPDGTAIVTVRQASEDENILRSRLFATTRYVNTGKGAVAAEQDLNPRELRRKEAYITLANVSGITDEKGRELFKSRDEGFGERVRDEMSESEFNIAWGRLPSDMADEICKKVLTVNKDWDPNRTGESAATSTS